MGRMEFSIFILSIKIVDLSSLFVEDQISYVHIGGLISPGWTLNI